MKKYIKYLYIIIPVIILIAGSFYLSNNKTEKNIPVEDGAGNVVETDTVQTKEVTTVTSTEVNGYKIEFSSDGISMEGSSNVVVLKDNQKMFEATDAVFSGFYVGEVGDWIENAGDLKEKAIKDITGNGIPELFLDGYSGGAHCCTHNYIIELSNPISILFDLDTGDSGIEFKDLNNDGIMELVTREDVFAYWHTSFVGSPMPRVVLSLQNGKYKADPKYMRKPALTDAEVKKMADDLESWADKDGIYPEVAWRIYAIDLIYSGNIASARKYVDLVWHYNDDGTLEEYAFKTKEDFWKELDEQIKTSPYYNDLVSFLNL